MENKKQNLKEEDLTADYNQEQDQDQEHPTGEFTRPMIVKNMVESFDHFRQGMDKLANVFPLMDKIDPDLYRKTSRFGDAMTKLMEGYAKLVESQGGEIEDISKQEMVNQYFGKSGLNAIGLNEDRGDVFDTRVDLSIDRIKNIMKNKK
jgi:hypothetical protein